MRNKLLKYFNLVLSVVSIIISLYFVIFRDNEVGLILKDLSIIITINALFVIEKIFKIKIDIITKTVYVVFVFLAHFLGAICELYNVFNGFDKFTHWLSGILTAYASILLLKILKKYNRKDKLFNIIFIISVTFMVAGLWEIFEFVVNILFGGDAQRVALTGVTDTMMDIIVAFLGSIIYSIGYLFYKKEN